MAPSQENRPVKRVEAELQPGVKEAVVKMYDRYFSLMITNPSGKPIMSFPDFLNQLLIRGMYAYDELLLQLENR